MKREKERKWGPLLLMLLCVSLSRNLGGCVSMYLWGKSVRERKRQIERERVE